MGKSLKLFFHIIKSKRAMYYARREYPPYVHSCVKDMNIFNCIIWCNGWQTEEDIVASGKKNYQFWMIFYFLWIFLFLFALRLHGKLSHSYRISPIMLNFVAREVWNFLKSVSQFCFLLKIKALALYWRMLSGLFVVKRCEPIAPPPHHLMLLWSALMQ